MLALKKKCRLLSAVSFGALLYMTFVWPSRGRHFLRQLNLEEIPRNASIFFTENNLRLESFHGRLLCAFESAALHNPESPVYVLQSTSSAMTSVPAVLPDAYPNLQFVRIDWDSVAANTQLDSIWPEVKASRFHMENVSNALRLLLLYKYGGMYMDTDVITLRGKPDERNAIVAEQLNLVNGAVMKFEAGHDFLDTALKEMAGDFRGSKYGYQGPYLMSRVIKDFCPGHFRKQISRKTCPNMVILPPSAAYPLDWPEWRDYYNASLVDYVQDKVSGSFVVHYWNYIRSVDEQLWTVEEDQPLYKLFKDNCPLTEQHFLRSMIGQPY